MRTITNKELIEAIEKHLEEETLGAQQGYDCCRLRYKHDPNHRCAIGAVMTPEEIDEVEGMGFGGTVLSMVNAHLANFENVPFAVATQILHDQWLYDSHLTLDQKSRGVGYHHSDNDIIVSRYTVGLEDRMMEMVNEINTDRIVNEEVFRRWIALAREVYIEGA